MTTSPRYFTDGRRSSRTRQSLASRGQLGPKPGGFGYDSLTGVGRQQRQAARGSGRTKRELRWPA